MSYIHEALKKAQKEKDLLASKGAWSTYSYGHQYGLGILKQKWTVTVCLIALSIGFSAYSWLHSLNRLASSDKAASSVNQAPVAPPDRPEPAASPSPTSSRKGPLKFRVPKAKPEPIKRAVPSAKHRKKPQQAQPGKPESEKAMTLYSRALALQKQGRLQDAKRFYEAALKRSPQLASALNNLGAIYISEKNYAAARRVLDKAIRIKSGFVDPYYNLACLYSLQNDVSQSLSYLKKAVSVDEAARVWAKTDKDLQNLRGHSEYEKIIQGAQ